MSAAAEFPTDGLRWGLSAVVVLIAHLASALGLAYLPDIAPPSSPPPAVLLELAPLPAAPLPAERPPAPPRQHVDQPPPVPEAVKPPVAIPKPPPKPRLRRPKPPEPKVVEKPTPREEPPVKTMAAAAVAKTAKAPVKAPPTQSVVAARTSSALPTFEQRLLAHLERYKRYPLRSRQRHESGVVYLRFAMDRGGAVLSARIQRSSGHAALDDEVLSLVRRAQPMPLPPPEITGATLDLVVPVRFSMR